MASSLESLTDSEIGSTSDSIASKDGSFISKIFSRGRKSRRDQMYPSSQMIYHTKRASELLKKRRTRSALIEIEQVMKIADNNPNLKDDTYADALMAWSEASYQLKFYNFARQFMAEAIQIVPDNLRALVIHGKANSMRGYSRVSDSLFQRTILKWTGIEKINYINPDYQTAIDSLEQAKDIIENNTGVLQSEKDKYRREVNLHLGGSYRSAIEENAIPQGDPIDMVQKLTAAYHDAFLADPKATDEEAISTHSALAKYYRETIRLKGTQTEAVEEAAQTAYNEAVEKSKKAGWDPKIEAARDLRQIYADNPHFLAPLASLAKLHAGLAKYVNKQRSS